MHQNGYAGHAGLRLPLQRPGVRQRELRGNESLFMRIICHSVMNV